MNIKDFSNQNAGQLHSKEKLEKQNPQKNKVIDETFSDFEEIKKTEEFKKVQQNYGDFVKDFVDKYGELSEQELITEMLKLVANKKSEGNFDAEKIKQMAGVLSPLLDQEQQQKMQNILKYLD